MKILRVTIVMFLCLALLLIPVCPYFKSYSYASQTIREKEPNNGFSTANPITLNTTYIANLHNASDVDYFTFELPSDGKITINFMRKDIGKTTWHISLLDSNNNKYLEVYNDKAVLNQDSGNAYLSKGKYYVKVQNSSYSSDNMDYYITVNFTSGEYFEKELNNSFSTANPIKLNSNYTGSIQNLYPKDIDYFKFVLPVADRVSLQVTNAIRNSNAGWQFELLNPHNNRLLNFGKYINTGTYTSTNVSLAAGTYYVRVSGLAWGSMPEDDYTFKVITDAIKQGWVKENNKWYYYDEVTGQKKIGWLFTGGRWYYLGNDGAMFTGWLKHSNKWYFLGSDGAMRTGWLQSGGKWYFLDNGGVLVTGWRQVSGKWYFLDGGGVMVTGWRLVSGNWYFFDGGGTMVTGWRQISSKWYYFYSSGSMAANTTINGYRLGRDGAWIP